MGIPVFRSSSVFFRAFGIPANEVSAFTDPMNTVVGEEAAEEAIISGGEDSFADLSSQPDNVAQDFSPASPVVAQDFSPASSIGRAKALRYDWYGGERFAESPATAFMERLMNPFARIVRAASAFGDRSSSLQAALVAFSWRSLKAALPKNVAEGFSLPSTDGTLKGSATDPKFANGNDKAPRRHEGPPPDPLLASPAPDGDMPFKGTSKRMEAAEGSGKLAGGRAFGVNGGLEKELRPNTEVRDEIVEIVQRGVLAGRVEKSDPKWTGKLVYETRNGITVEFEEESYFGQKSYDLPKDRVFDDPREAVKRMYEEYHQAGARDEIAVGVITIDGQPKYVVVHGDRLTVLPIGRALAYTHSEGARTLLSWNDTKEMSRGEHRYTYLVDGEGAERLTTYTKLNGDDTLLIRAVMFKDGQNTEKRGVMINSDQGPKCVIPLEELSSLISRAMYDGTTTAEIKLYGQTIKLTVKIHEDGTIEGIDIQDGNGATFKIPADSIPHLKPYYVPPAPPPSVPVLSSSFFEEIPGFRKRVSSMDEAKEWLLEQYRAHPKNMDYVAVAREADGDFYCYSANARIGLPRYESSQHASIFDRMRIGETVIFAGVDDRNNFVTAIVTRLAEHIVFAKIPPEIYDDSGRHVKLFFGLRSVEDGTVYFGDIDIPQEKLTDAHRTGLAFSCGSCLTVKGHHLRDGLQVYISPRANRRNDFNVEITLPEGFEIVGGSKLTIPFGAVGGIVSVSGGGRVTSVPSAPRRHEGSPPDKNVLLETNGGDGFVTNYETAVVELARAAYGFMTRNTQVVSGASGQSITRFEDIERPFREYLRLRRSGWVQDTNKLVAEALVNTLTSGFLSPAGDGAMGQRRVNLELLLQEFAGLISIVSRQLAKRALEGKPVPPQAAIDFPEYGNYLNPNEPTPTVGELEALIKNNLPNGTMRKTLIGWPGNDTVEIDAALKRGERVYIFEPLVGAKRFIKERYRKKVTIIQDLDSTTERFDTIRISFYPRFLIPDTIARLLKAGGIMFLQGIGDAAKTQLAIEKDWPGFKILLQHWGRPIYKTLYANAAHFLGVEAVVLQNIRSAANM